MLMKSYPGKRNPSQSKLRSVLLEISNNVLPAIQIKLLSRTWRLNRSHSLPASFHVLMEKSLSFCLQFRDAHEGSTLLENKRQPRQHWVVIKPPSLVFSLKFVYWKKAYFQYLNLQTHLSHALKLWVLSPVPQLFQNLVSSHSCWPQ